MGVLPFGVVRCLSLARVSLVIGASACAGKTAPPGPPPDDMVEVPAATLALGCRDRSDPACPSAPAKSVALAAFRIDRTEVSAGDYRRCVAAGACTPLREPRQRARMPARVDWDQADAYCRWRDARLPREAQWELAARGTDGRLYPWGDAAPTCADAHYTNACDHQPGELADVGTYPRDRSPYGVLDLAGNAPEWTVDPYTDVYDPDPAALDPAALERRVVRGDLTNQGPPCCPIYARHGETKVLTMVGAPVPSFTGFRCVKASAAGPS